MMKENRSVTFIFMLIFQNRENRNARALSLSLSLAWIMYCVFEVCSILSFGQTTSG